MRRSSAKVCCPAKAFIINICIYIFVFNLPYVLIQRYNRPRLVKLYNKLRLKNPDFVYTNSEDELSLSQ